MVVEVVIDSSQAVIFVHVPKSAGTTLNYIVAWEYSPLRICHVDGRFYRAAFHRISRRTPRQLDKYDLFSGHMPFGLHRRLTRKATYITVLRDPVERVISEYYYRQERRSHPIADIGVKGLSLRDYLEKLPYDNVQTKLLAGTIPDYDYLAGSCDEEMLTVAKRNLAEHFTLVGLTERFEETLGLLKVLLGWKVGRFVPMRVTRGKPQRASLPPDVRDLIAEHNRFDRELYAYGTELFDRVLAEHREAVAEAVKQVRAARLPEGKDASWYDWTTYFRRLFVRASSAL